MIQVRTLRLKPEPTSARCLASRQSRRKESSHENVRSMPWKAGIRCPRPQYMERSLVGSCSVLLGSLRRHLSGQAKRGRQRALARLPRSRLFEKLTVGIRVCQLSSSGGGGLLGFWQPHQRTDCAKRGARSYCLRHTLHIPPPCIQRRPEKGSKQVDVLDVQPAAAAREQIAAAVFEWQLGLHNTMLAGFLPPIKISVARIFPSAGPPRRMLALNPRFSSPRGRRIRSAWRKGACRRMLLRRAN
jgi:hypothetical protein